MSDLSFQQQACTLSLEDGLIEYRSYLQMNNKKQLKDAPGSSIIRDHDVTHVIFGLDTSLEQESLLDSWLFSGASWKCQNVNAAEGIATFRISNAESIDALLTQDLCTVVPDS